MPRLVTFPPDFRICTGYRHCQSLRSANCPYLDKQGSVQVVENTVSNDAEYIPRPNRCPRVIECPVNDDKTFRSRPQSNPANGVGGAGQFKQISTIGVQLSVDVGVPEP